MSDQNASRASNWVKPFIIFVIQLGLSYGFVAWYAEHNPDWAWAKNAVLVMGAIGAVVCFFLYRFLNKKLDQLQEKMNAKIEQDSVD